MPALFSDTEPHGFRRVIIPILSSLRIAEYALSACKPLAIKAEPVDCEVVMVGLVPAFQMVVHRLVSSVFEIVSQLIVALGPYMAFNAEIGVPRSVCC